MKLFNAPNLEGRRVAAAKKTEWKKIDKPELIAFISITFPASVKKNCDISVREHFTDPLQNFMCRATMSINIFEDIRRCCALT